MKIKELLKNPESWTRGTYAKDAKGEGVMSRDAKAVCWCLLGALYRCYPDNTVAISQALTDGAKSSNLAVWNDNHTHAEVLALVEKLDI